jgi:hypothetical protein
MSLDPTLFKAPHVLDVYSSVHISKVQFLTSHLVLFEINNVSVVTNLYSHLILFFFTISWLSKLGRII